MNAPANVGLGRAHARNLTYRLHEAFGMAIVGGEFEGRPFPIEQEISRRHGVSRTVTREALKMLSAKGLIGARPKQGTFVLPEQSWNLLDTDVLRWMLERRPSLEMLRRFNELRLAVEPKAAALAAARATRAQRDTVAASLEAMVLAERCGRGELEADIAFHFAILTASNNPFFRQFCDIVDTALRISLRVTNPLTATTANIEQHRAVADAIAAGDADRAEDMMRDLIQAVLRLIDTAV